MIEDKEFHKRKADTYVSEGSCYIHTEMRSGKNPETIIAGDMMAIAWGISAEISRLSEIAKSPVPITMELIRDMLDACEGKEMPECQGKRIVNKKRPMMVVDGQDWQEEWIADKEKQYAKKYKKLESKVSDYQHQIEVAETLVQNVKKNFEAEKDRMRRDSEALQKEIDRLNHRLAEMEQENMFRGVRHD